MEEKLAAYRAKKQREELLSNTKFIAKSFLTKFWNGVAIGNWFRHKNNSKLDETNEPLISHPIKESNSDDEDTDENLVLPDEELDKINCFSTRQIIKFIIIATIWASLYALFIMWGFGAVYFIISGLVFIYANTRTTKKGKNEVSAYSVFNRNCESIQGTVKAEDLERQMVYGHIF